MINWVTASSSTILHARWLRVKMCLMCESKTRTLFVEANFENLSFFQLTTCYWFCLYDLPTRFELRKRLLQNALKNLHTALYIQISVTEHFNPELELIDFSTTGHIFIGSNDVPVGRHNSLWGPLSIKTNPKENIFMMK